MATFTEFYVQTTGSNLNAGSTNADAASFTYASGSWVAATGVFTVGSGNPLSDGVAVGDFAGVFPDGSTVGVFVGRVTARDATTITVSLTAKSGTAPTDGTNTRTLKIGGAWAGSNAAVGFPFGFVQNTMTDASNNVARINWKNGVTYSVTAAMTHANAGPIRWEGYTSTPGDGGMAIIDGGVAGASFVLLTVSAILNSINGFIFQNNGATGSASGVLISATTTIKSCVFNSMRGFGCSMTGVGIIADTCEYYACNQSNTANIGGVNVANHGSGLLNCVVHDNIGSNSVGVFIPNSSMNFVSNSVIDSNGQDGIRAQSSSVLNLLCNGNEFYNNGGDGLEVNENTNGAQLMIVNCNFLKNGGWAILGGGNARKVGVVSNCGFGSGTQENVSGTIGLLPGVTESGSIIYAADVTPWVDPEVGDFRINLAAAKGAGRGLFLQTAANYAGTVGYPDIGAAQHLDSGDGGTTPTVIGTGTETLDRLMEELLRGLIIDQVSSPDAQVCTSLMGAGEAAAVLPRIVIKCQSQDTPELYEAGVFRILTQISSIAEATSQISSDDLLEMNTAVDRAIIFADNIPASLTSTRVLTFGVVHGASDQMFEGNRLIRIRTAEIWAKLLNAP